MVAPGLAATAIAMGSPEVLACTRNCSCSSLAFAFAFALALALEFALPVAEECRRCLSLSFDILLGDLLGDNPPLVNDIILLVLPKSLLLLPSPLSMVLILCWSLRGEELPVLLVIVPAHMVLLPAVLLLLRLLEVAAVPLLIRRPLPPLSLDGSRFNGGGDGAGAVLPLLPLPLLLPVILLTFLQ